MADGSTKDTLERLFAAEREARRIHDELAGGDRTAVMAAVVAAIGESDRLEEVEATTRLVCAARLLGEFEGPEVADALIDILNKDQPEVRSEAGDQLQGLAYDRFKEVALAVERALGRLGVGSNALVELPYLLTEIPEPGVVTLLAKFLAHDDPDGVAAAIEALVEVGDPSAVGALEKLRDDKRKTRLGDEEELEGGDVTVGELAEEAIQLLQAMEEHGE